MVTGRVGGCGGRRRRSCQVKELVVGGKEVCGWVAEGLNRIKCRAYCGRVDVRVFGE